MQALLSIILAIVTFFSGIGGAFSSPGNIIWPWSRPGEVVTDRAAVIAIYREIAAQNPNIELRENIRITDYPSIPLVPMGTVRTAVNLAFAFSNTTRDGMPGNPAAIAVGDLRLARAEYFNNGRTVVITLEPNAQTDGFNGQANAGPVGRTIGVLGTQVQGILGVLAGLPGLGLGADVMSTLVRVRYVNPTVTIRADTRTGRILSAEYSYDFVLEIPLPLVPNFRIGASYRLST